MCRMCEITPIVRLLCTMRDTHEELAFNYLVNCYGRCHREAANSVRSARRAHSTLAVLIAQFLPDDDRQVLKTTTVAIMRTLGMLLEGALSKRFARALLAHNSHVHNSHVHNSHAQFLNFLLCSNHIGDIGALLCRAMLIQQIGADFIAELVTVLDDDGTLEQVRTYNSHCAAESRIHV